MKALVNRWDALVAEEARPGITRQSVSGAACTVVRYIYQPGSVFPVHSHPEEQITVVHSGEIEFEVDGERVVLRAGDVAVIPGGTPHGARVLSGEPVVTDNYIPSARRSALQWAGESV